MRSAARLYRLHLSLALTGALAVVLVLLVAVDAATTHQLSPSVLVVGVAVPRPPLAGFDAALLLMLGAIATGSVAFGLRAVVVECVAQRHARRALRGSARIAVDDAVIRVTGDDRPNAFCHGLLRPQVYVSRGALATLSPAELAALTAHERHHVHRRDPLRLALARVLGGALFFLPALPRLQDRYARQTELAADEAALRDGQDLTALASALLAFDDSGAGVHPDRVDRLLGHGADARVPFAWVMASLAIVAIIASLGLAGADAIGHAPQLLGQAL